MILLETSLLELAYERRAGADPPAVAVTPAGYAIYQVTEIEAAQAPTFDQIKSKIEEQFSASQLAMVHSKRQKAAGDSDLSDQAWLSHNESPDTGQVSQSDRPLNLSGEFVRKLVLQQFNLFC